MAVSFSMSSRFPVRRDESRRCRLRVCATVASQRRLPPGSVGTRADDYFTSELGIQ